MNRDRQKALIFALIFFTLLAYLCSLEIETMSFVEELRCLKKVWLKATSFQTEEDVEEKEKEEKNKFMVELIGKWYCDCWGLKRPEVETNDDIETWIKIVMAYFFLLVWSLLKFSEIYYFDKREMEELREERMSDLRAANPEVAKSKPEVAKSKPDVTSPGSEVESKRTFVEISSVFKLETDKALPVASKVRKSKKFRFRGPRRSFSEPNISESENRPFLNSISSAMTDITI